MLKAQIRLVSKAMFGLDLLDHDDVLDADSEGAIFIVAWLVGDDVAGCEGDFRVLDASADSDGPFVDVEVRAYAVAGAMAVV